MALRCPFWDEPLKTGGPIIIQADGWFLFYSTFEIILKFKVFHEQILEECYLFPHFSFFIFSKMEGHLKV